MAKEGKSDSNVDLNSSLTAMDWLGQLTVGSLANGGKQPTVRVESPAADGMRTVGAIRKPPEPIDPHATLSTQDIARYQDGKPPFSYAMLITYAINSSGTKKMTLSEIYAWICDNFPYYHDAGNGWKVARVSSFSTPCVFPVIDMRRVSPELYQAQPVVEQMFREDAAT